MTVTHKIHVNGRYEVTATNTTTGDVVVIGPQEEKFIPHRHGVKNVVELEERYLGEQMSTAEKAAAEAAENTQQEPADQPEAGSVD